MSQIQLFMSKQLLDSYDQWKYDMLTCINNTFISWVETPLLLALSHELGSFTQIS